MRRSALPFAMSLLVAAAACGPAQVVVTIEIDFDDPDAGGSIMRALSDLEVRLLPYDRDAIFDSMTAAFDTPEPAIPDDLVEARNEVRVAQEEWQQSQARWNTIRDTLQKLNTALEQYSRGEDRYTALFREWNDFDGELSGVDRQMTRSFDRFTELQQGTIRASDSVRILQDNWGDEAFLEVGEVFDEKSRASRLSEATDTTDANGVARRNLQVKPGVYWVHARYELAYTELYWNVMITVVRGEPYQVRLTRENADERIKL
jgi:hypothetical protein